MNRRDFLRSASIAATVAAGLGTHGMAAGAQTRPAGEPNNDEEPDQAPQQTRRGTMLYRRFGRTHEEISAIGMGGFHVGKIDDEQDAIQLVRKAIDRGITFMDNCWDYHNGRSEVLMGKALQNGYRDKVFLMTKVDGRTKQAAAAQLDESLRRLKTDRIDLLQIHELIRPHGPDQCFADDGAIHALLAARKAGKIRYIGFTGHKDPLVHLRMLDTAKAHDVQFDAVQMPLNVLDAQFRSFRRQVLPRAVSEGLAVLGMKPMGGGVIVENTDKVTAQDCLHFALHLPTSTVITGMERERDLDQALAAAESFDGLSHEELAALLQRVESLAANGKYELYKTTAHFDGTASHPEWLTATPS